MAPEENRRLGMTVFEVNEDGTLYLSGVFQPQTHWDYYEVEADTWLRSPEGLLGSYNLGPVEGVILESYEAIINSLKKEYDEITCGPEHRARPGFADRKRVINRRLKESPAEPNERDAADWVMNLSQVEFDQLVVPWIIKWLEEETGSSEDSLPLTYDPMELALEFFQELRADDPKIFDDLGIKTIEGEFPGSSYFAAELSITIEDANEMVEQRGLDFRFKRYGS